MLLMAGTGHTQPNLAPSRPCLLDKSGLYSLSLVIWNVADHLINNNLKLTASYIRIYNMHGIYTNFATLRIG
jgi:hypothetical protein